MSKDWVAEWLIFSYGLVLRYGFRKCTVCTPNIAYSTIASKRTIAHRSGLKRQFILDTSQNEVPNEENNSGLRWIGLFRRSSRISFQLNVHG